MATEQIEKDLLEAHDIGERAYRCFSQQRLESNPAKEKFFDAMKKVNLKTFAHLSKKSPKGNYKRNHSESGQRIVCTDDRNS